MDESILVFTRSIHPYQEGSGGSALSMTVTRFIFGNITTL
jgi:hypothetical protein